MLTIPGNYYDDLEARLGVDTTRAARARAALRPRRAAAASSCTRSPPRAGACSSSWSSAAAATPATAPPTPRSAWRHNAPDGRRAAWTVRKTPVKAALGERDRQRARVLRLLHLRHRRRARVRQGVLPGLRPGHRDAAVVRHLRRRLRRPAGRRVLHGPPRRPLRPQARARADGGDDGRLDVPRRLPADLRRHRDLGAGAAGRAAADAGLLGVRRAVRAATRSRSSTRRTSGGRSSPASR